MSNGTYDVRSARTSRVQTRKVGRSEGGRTRTPLRLVALFLQSDWDTAHGLKALTETAITS